MPEEPKPVDTHTLEGRVRENIKAVRDVTGEHHTDIGRVLGLSVAVVGRRQCGETRWAVAEVELLAEHWRIEASLMFSPEAAKVVAALPRARVEQLRAAKRRRRLPAPTRSKTPVAA
ncbi:helix-turn-helix domain-containing protein [Streptomyces sp. NBC_00470]|uniref:helix-turn-helix domain-containing protein n=1 Tax=Streptomyces sp. NBC_00470 TaxID=2975753 RepID=UPI002F91AD29